MIIYKDVITGDEMFSDSYPMKEVDDIFYEVKGKLTTEVTKVDDSMIGGNASADEPAEAAGDSSVSGVNIILSNRLVETSFTKKDYQKYIKSYMKKIVQYIEGEGELEGFEIDSPEKEDPTDFKKAAAPAIKKVLEQFDDYQFFMGESCSPDGMHALLKYGEDGMTPYMYFFKHGLAEEKV